MNTYSELKFISYNDIKDYFKGIELGLDDIRFLNAITRTCKNSDFWLFNDSKYSYIIYHYFNTVDEDKSIKISKDNRFIVVPNSFIGINENSYIILPITKIEYNKENSITSYDLVKPYSPVKNMETDTVNFFHPRYFCNAEAAMLFLCVNLMQLKYKYSDISPLDICDERYES